MKKILQSALAAALLLGAGTAQAQLSAGHILLGGSLGYFTARPSGTSDNSPKFNAGVINPRVGYFIMDNLVVGLDLNYMGENSISKNEVSFKVGSNLDGKKTLTDTRTSSTMSFGPFARYYKPVGEHAAFFGQVNFGFGTRKEKTEDERVERNQTSDDDELKTISTETKYSQLNVAIAPGFTYFPTDNFGLEVMMGGLSWNRERRKDLPTGAKEEDYTNTDLSFSYMLQDLRVGATWYLGGK